MEKPRFSLVLPVYNEAEIITEVVADYFNILKQIDNLEFIVAEDGSNDGTSSILRDINKSIPFTLFQSGERKGYTMAVLESLRLAQGEWILFSDSDGQHDAADFLKMIEHFALKSGSEEAERPVDMIIGLKSPRQDNLLRRLMGYGYNKLINIIFKTNFHDIDCGFRIIHRDLIKKVIPKCGKFSYCISSEITIRAFHLIRVLKLRSLILAINPEKQVQAISFI